MFALVAIGGHARTDSTQHVWLHYDYMVDPSGHSLAPDPRSVALVVDAFAAHGIELHIDEHHTVVPYHALLNFDESANNESLDLSDPHCAIAGFGPADVVSFTELKADYFRPTANHPWHYAIFGDLDSCTAESGFAALPGEDFVVTLGGYRRIGVPIEPLLEGGALMHELGHNFGLTHGGAIDFQNWKTNYVSVMNYRFQFGIPYAAAPGSTSIVGRRLDYSEEALPTLDERHLSEYAGLGATLAVDRADVTSWANPGPGPVGAVGSSTGPLDWNQNGLIEPDVAVDLDFPFNTLQCLDGENVFPFCHANYFFESQHGFDDWQWVHAYLAGTVSPGPKTFAHEDRADEPIVSGVLPARGPEAGGNLVVITGQHFEKVTHVSFGGMAAPWFSVANDGTLRAVVPSGTGTVDVVVTSGDNRSPSLSADEYTYLPAPVVSGITPAVGGPGTVVTVTGSGMSETVAVDFGAVRSAAFTVVDDTAVMASVPAGTDTVDVTVTSTGGVSARSASDQFTYVPVVTSISPASGPAGTVVTIRGTSFGGFVTACFGTFCVADAVALDATTVSATVPAALTGGATVDITVVAKAGASAPVVADRFTVR